jgi:serine protease Do
MRAAPSWKILFALALFALITPGVPAAETPDTVALTGRAKKSVAVITHFGRDGKQDGVGAGFVVDAGGLIATCYHVIGEARPISVELNGRRYEVTEVFASDRKLDLAVVRIAASNLPALKLGDSAALKQGASVIALGNPVGLEHSVVQGVVSAKREFDGVELIQLAIPIEPGNSGGPLLDARGRVQGLLNMKSAVTANLGFAVPVNALKTLLDRPNPVPMSRWLMLGALDPQEWRPVLGARWSRKAGRIQVEGAGSGFGGRALCLWQQDTPAPPYELSVTVKLDDESGAAGLAFASDGGDRHYGFYPTAGQMRLTRFDGPDVFSWNVLKEFKSPHYLPGEWNTIRLRVETNRLTGWVNGEKVLESADAAWREGRVGLAKFRDTRAQFKNFRLSTNLSAAPVTITAAKLENTFARSDRQLLDGTKDAAGRASFLEHARVLDQEAARLRRLAEKVHARAVHALLVAKLDQPELDVEDYRAELRRLAAELKRQVPTHAHETNQIAALSKFLFTDQGFHGSRVDFYHRANSYMNQVLDDREGLPITLAVLWLELARQLGVTNVAGVPLPTRFMVRFAPPGGGEQIIDVFDGGKVLTRGDAVELVADNTGRIGEEHFAPAKKRAIITRMLNNLLGLAQREGATADALRYLDAMIALEPDSVEERLHRARALMQRGDKEGAKEDLRWLLDRQPEGVDLERLGEYYRSL